jgi:hypothetical protein
VNRSFSIGWDVGAWASKSGDALWILDPSGNTLGTPWKGNLGEAIRGAVTAKEFILALFTCCNGGSVPARSLVTLAIDAPLAFPAGFVKLLDGTVAAEPLGRAIDNPYLFRRTEAFAQEELGRNPLSPLQDQIGSQSTKIAHVLAKFGLTNNFKGVWTGPDTGDLKIRVIEAYPAMSKQREGRRGPVELRPGPVKTDVERLLKSAPSTSPDQKDALICALIARMHARSPQDLYAPTGDHFLPEEGWIWFPKSATSP